MKFFNTQRMIIVIKLESTLEKRTGTKNVN